MPHPDLAAEQAHIDLAYEQLEAMRSNALTALRAAFSERGGTFQSVTERDIRVRTSLNRLEQLQLGRESLVFGRIDRRPDGNDAPNGAAGPEAFHIGRLAVADEALDPLVVDWRAPVAEPFYRATGAQPMGLVRRRHFLTEGRRVLDLEDELFGEPVADGAGDGAGGLGAGLAGSATLLAALGRSRTGRMRDIVATVQREQDEIIRSPLAGVLVVQGGPGTGKTAVALHRAAYLLYTYRFPLESQGVLVVGPNPLFLRYIEHVLPSLGETGVEMATVGKLFGAVAATAEEDTPTAALKGDARMSRFLARAVANRQRPLRRPVEVPYGSTVLTLTAAASADIVATAKRRAGTHNARRRLVEQLLWRHLHGRLREARARAGRDEAFPEPVPGPWAALAAADGHDAPVASEITPADLGAELRRLPVVAEALDRMWPVLTPQEVLHDLFGAPPLVELAGRGLLSEDEQARLVRPRSESAEAVAWTEADLALLDEARAHLGPPRRRGDRSDDDGPRSFGHIVVDEAQDLSPMQWRMLARRSLSSSMTIVGDIAQATGSWAPTWDQALQHLNTRRGTRLVELTVNYRTPSEVMDLAGKVLDAAAPGMVVPQSVRSSGEQPRFLRAPPTSLGPAVASAVVEELAAVTDPAERAGTVGVLCAPSMVDRVAAALRDAAVPYGTVEAGALDDQVTAVSVRAAKGLEFDAVVVVEPGRIVDESAQGLRALYVALTRATKRLTIVYSADLPPPLASAFGS